MRIDFDFIKEKAGRECVIVPTGKGYQNGVFRLNEDAEKIYDLLCENKSRDEIVNILSKEYDDKFGRLSATVDKYIEQLKKVGILIDD